MAGRFNVQDYIDVQERINKFWTEYPNGAIDTEVTFSPDYDHVVITAKVYKDKADPRPSASGIAAEERGTRGANETSWHENCDTSAIGRALANMGYAKDGKTRPSRQEMQKVNRLAAEESKPLTVSALELYTIPDLFKKAKELNTKGAWENVFTKVGSDEDAWVALISLADSPKLLDRLEAKATEVFGAPRVRIVQAVADRAVDLGASSAA